MHLLGVFRKLVSFSHALFLGLSAGQIQKCFFKVGSLLIKINTAITGGVGGTYAP